MWIEVDHKLINLDEAISIEKAENDTIRIKFSNHTMILTNPGDQSESSDYYSFLAYILTNGNESCNRETKVLRVQND